MTTPSRTAATGYFFLRVAIGINLFAHGMVRFVGGGYRDFVSALEKGFAETPLPKSLVSATACVIPPLEVVLGLLLVLGLLTFPALIAGMMLMLVLIFGKCMQQDWNVVGLQMVYVIVYYLLFLKIEENRYAFDRIFQRE